MVICDQPAFILFSMEKTGTTSMDYVLSDYFDERKYRLRLLRKSKSRFFLQPKRRRRLLAHAWNSQPELKHSSPAWLLRNKRIVLGDRHLRDFFKLCFVRNPFDRLLSVYSFHTQRIPHKYPAAAEAGNFKNWLMMGGTGSARKSMKTFLVDDNSRLLVDFVGRYETLEQDWHHFLDRVGLPSISLPTDSRTATDHRDWREVWTDELREILVKNPTWSADYTYFGYDKLD